MVENNQNFATYGINAVCTHLGCIVPWNTVQKKFMCPCHGSEYDNVGKVIKGPAPKVNPFSQKTLPVQVYMHEVCIANAISRVNSL